MMNFFRKDDCARDYKIGDELGRGSFAVVKRAVFKKDNSLWALKCIDKSKLEHEDEQALKTEVAIMEQMNHPHIVRMKACYDTQKTFYMVLELMTGGELFDRIVQKGKYSEKEAADSVSCLAEALAYCHGRGIVHRDLKPENLLYVDQTDGSPIKIADFGLAKILNQNKMMATACGTPGYVAPEILLAKPYTDRVDLWSLGVITYILLCGFPPFYDENNATLFAQIKAGAFDFPAPYWDEIGEGAKDFIRQLLVVDPSKRLSAAAVLQHPWIRGGAGTAKLESAFTQMRRFNARRRFRAGVKKVMAAQAFARFGKLRHDGPGTDQVFGPLGGTGAGPQVGNMAVAEMARAAGAAASTATTAAPVTVVSGRPAPAVVNAQVATGTGKTNSTNASSTPSTAVR